MLYFFIILSNLLPIRQSTIGTIYEKKLKCITYHSFAEVKVLLNNSTK